MPPDLVLTPALTDQDRATIEAHLEQVRSRRLLAAIEYHTGRNAKLEHESARLQRRLEREYDMLMKDIAALDRADAKIEKRLVTIASLKSTHSNVQSEMVVLDTDDDATNDD